MNKNSFPIINSGGCDIFDEAVEKGVFPGVSAGVGLADEKSVNLWISAMGYLEYSEKREVNKNTFYDLASLTKPLATTLSVLCLLKEGTLHFSTRLADIFGSLVPEEKKNIPIARLLGHSAGFPALRPYHTELLDTEESERKKKLFSLIMEEPLAYEQASMTVYSDIGYMLLGLIIEKISKTPLDKFVKERVFEPLGLSRQLQYGPLSLQKQEKMSIAPGEHCAVRNKILCGEVSDENAYSMGGVAGHAGLFGTIQAVLFMGMHLLDQWKDRDEHPNYRNSDLRACFRKQNIPGSTWALGFDTPSARGSSGGSYLSPESVGHLGFTGTSLWIDPVRELVMVLLSNRVHPSRDNEQIKQFRPQFHNMIIENLDLK